ncbi:hypothetical protein JY651_32100 [Pyxidicoccus parkwayensis]|uniref:Lipoprotein n=1 Tax=Pyxidicoccus parkwayensis TaxID=2813578 RepID=A0ABX7NM13_9BACT|nr:hypothetical protein [Pyxidicoccus parkwaysis]QSQ19907.1 hypothetical protein JY651_32100 [Pyxidicoccus parkwaysis]
MNQREPVFYNLEFTENDAPFWAEAGNTTRCAFLMPLPDPSGFVAFGVVGSDSTLLFVARGRVHEHLGAFIASMNGGGARVELYARAPLPWDVVKRYTSDDPYENQETEGPREPPVRGLVGYGGGADAGSVQLQQASTATLSAATLAWPSAALPSTRRVYVMPGAATDEFLAFGVCSSPDRFVFLARGRKSDELEGFLARVRLDGATVEECTWPAPLYLQAYLNQHASLYQPNLRTGCAAA